MRLGVAAINAQIHALAPALNAPELADWGQVQSTQAEIPIAVSAKRSEDDLYLFAVPMRLGPTRGLFSIPDLAADMHIEVIGEGRSIQSEDGAFADAFAIYQVHRYRVVDYFSN